MSDINISEMIAVIQAGGLGTRMYSLTHNMIPKPMILLNGKPLILWQIEAFMRYGVKRFVIIVGHLSEIIKDYFENGEKYRISIEYIEEHEQLGSAGSLFYLKNYPSKSYFFVYGDIMFDIDIQRWIKFHRESNALVTLICHPNSHPYDSDLVSVNESGQVDTIIKKGNKRDGWYSNLVNAGLFIFQNDILQYFENCNKKIDWENDIIIRLIESERVFAYRTCEYIKDVGAPDRFKQSVIDNIQGKWKKKNISKKQKCIFLDRDGTLNKYKGLIYSPDQLELEDFVIDSIKLINQSDYLNIIVTNQPVVARGLCSEEMVNQINNKLETLLGNEGAFIDDIIYCPHHPDKGYPEENPIYKIKCECRKPDIGMIKRMADKYNINLSESYIIGDSSVDIQTGINAGLHTVLVKTGEQGRDGKYIANAEITANNLLEAVTLILNRRDYLNGLYT